MRARAAGVLTAAVLGSIAMLTGVQVSAHNPAGTPVTQPGPLACETTNYRVEAITGSSGEFPITQGVACNIHLGETCADYGYLISSKTAANFSQTVFAVAADQDTDRSSPTATVSPLGAGDNSGFLAKSQHEYTVRFNSGTTKSAEAHLFMVRPTTARMTTVLVRHGNTSESCLIAGPGGGAQLDPFKPLTQTQAVLCAGGGCTCNITNDDAGNIASVTTNTPGCTTQLTDVVVKIEVQPNVIEEQPVKHFESITSGSGTCTTYPTKPRATTICR